MPTATEILETQFDTLAERVDQSVNGVLALDVEGRDKAFAMKQAIEDFHQYALARLIQRLKADPNGRDLLFSLLDEPSIYAMFTMHGLIRVDLKTRVQRAIESIRPYMQSHSGDIEFVDVEDETAYVKLHGVCAECAMSSSTMQALEQVLQTQAPEITEIAVVPNTSTLNGGIIPLDAIAING